MASRGGRRPGAGAPKGNLNAVKSGRYSRAHQRAVLIIASVPELQGYLRALLRAQTRDRDRIVDGEIAVALSALAESPSLRESIKSYVSQRVRSAPPQLQNLYFAAKETEFTILQSNAGLLELLDEISQKRAKMDRSPHVSPPTAAAAAQLMNTGELSLDDGAA